MENLTGNSGSRILAAQTGMKVVNDAIKILEKQSASTSTSSVQNTSKMEVLLSSIPLLNKFGKDQDVPDSPTKKSKELRLTVKVKRAFLYLLLPFLEGGLLCPYVKLGYITMDITDDVWMKLHQTLRRYATTCNDYYFELIPVCDFVKVTPSIYFFVTIIISMLMLNQLLQGSKIENWLLKTFSSDKYQPKVNGLEDMKDGRLKTFLKTRVNENVEEFYRGKSDRQKDNLVQADLKVSFYICICADYLSIVTSCVV